MPTQKSQLLIFSNSSLEFGVKTLIVSKESKGVKAINVGGDNIGSKTPLVKTIGGSFIGVNLMRYNGISFENKNTSLLLYNRLTINNQSEKNINVY